MKWPQIDLRRIFLAIALLGTSLACLMSALRTWRYDLAFVGLVLLSAALGSPFKMAFAAPVAVFLFALLLVILYSLATPWIRAFTL